MRPGLTPIVLCVWLLTGGSAHGQDNGQERAPPARIALLEINALVGTTGPTKKPIETVRGVIVTGVVTAALVYFIAQAVLSSSGA